MRSWLVPLLLTAAAAHAQPDSAVTWGRRYTDWFFADHLRDVFARFTPAMRQALDSAKLAASREQIRTQLGGKQYVITEAESRRAPYTIYDQLIEVEKITQPVVVRWTLDTAGDIAGFFVRPAPVAEAVSAFLDYQTKTVLRLPFTGDWLVLWGGRTLAQNRHAASPDQRFAYDFVVTKDGATHTGDGAQLSQYYCYGRPVLAPGDGTAVEIVDTVADNAPGATNGNAPLGNHVIIDHGNGEFSFLAHLQHGSVVVARGQRVAQGSPVARCGNSGFSTEPHLHYHMQSTPSFMVGAGMPAQFQRYVADGKAVDRGEPARGQNIHTQ
jgi:murein DD-endopeptidase MepM/ murein hydrolase activator NlpD